MERFEESIEAPPEDVWGFIVDPGALSAWFGADAWMDLAEGGAVRFRFGDGTQQAFERYLVLRMRQPHFANARSVRNALDRARLRAASRLFAVRGRALTEADLATLAPEDILASRVFEAAA